MNFEILQNFLNINFNRKRNIGYGDKSQNPAELNEKSIIACFQSPIFFFNFFA